MKQSLHNRPGPAKVTFSVLAIRLLNFFVTFGLGAIRLLNCFEVTKFFSGRRVGQRWAPAGEGAVEDPKWSPARLRPNCSNTAMLLIRKQPIFKGLQNQKF